MDKKGKHLVGCYLSYVENGFFEQKKFIQATERVFGELLPTKNRPMGDFLLRKFIVLGALGARLGAPHRSKTLVE